MRTHTLVAPTLRLLECDIVPTVAERTARAFFDAATDGRMMQGFLEQSNVNPIIQIGRMIEVQRAYELGQSFMEKEDERIRGVIQSLSR